MPVTSLARGVRRRPHAPRRKPAPAPRVPSLFARIHRDAVPRVRRGTIDVPRESTGMGKLLELEVGALADPDRVSLWTFQGTLPRLGFEHVAPSARGARISRLWVVGGAYHFRDGRFHGSGARSEAPIVRLTGAAREKTARSRTGGRYLATHGGHAPREVVRGGIDFGAPLVPVGWMRAVSYHADKAERTDVDPADYRHPFEPEARPLLAVTADGRTLVCLSDRDVGAVRYEDPRTGAVFAARRFGRYTVTPHGIEDIA